MKKIYLNFLFLLFTLNAISQNCPPNLGFELGNLTNWTCETGTQFETGCNLTDTTKVTTTVSGAVSQKHMIISPSAMVDPFGGFAITPDGNNVAKLGSMGMINLANQLERISYSLNIPAGTTEYGLTYKFALVHNTVEPCHRAAPYFSVKVYDVTAGKYIDCFTREYFSTVAAHGFQLSPVTTFGPVKYKTWTPVSLNLSAYAGHTLKLEFTNSDCSTYGHWAYAYVDVDNANCSGVVGGNEYCPGGPASIVAPYGYQSYSWWNNGFTQNLGTGTSLVLTPAPVTPTIYAVDVIPFAGFGCRDTVYFTVKPKNVAPIPANAGPDVATCINGTGTAIGTPPVAGYNYSWSPTAGLSNSNFAQANALPATSTSFVLTVTDGASGCTNKDTVNVNVLNPPSPAYSVNTTTQCILGNQFQFTMNNTVAGSTYLWHFGDGSTSVLQNPPHVYLSIGTYYVTTIVTGINGCKDSSTQQVTVISAVPTPVITSSGNLLTSSATTGNQWYFNGNPISGATGQTYTASASGDYTVIVTMNQCTSSPSNTVNLKPTGINAVASEWKLQLAPNPVTDKLVISFAGNHKLDLEILDMTGRRLYASRGIPTTYAVDLSKFAGGTYLVRLVNNKSKKEVKQLIIKVD